MKSITGTMTTGRTIIQIEWSGPGPIRKEAEEPASEDVKKSDVSNHEASDSDDE
jgi:hypothetical protein